MDGRGGATKAAAIERRRQDRQRVMRGRFEQARTPEARLASAYDWLRGSLGQLSKPGRTGASPDRPAAERLMRVTADYLAALAAEIDEGLHDSQ